MRSGARSSGGVSEHDRRSDQTYKHGTSDGTGVARMTSVSVPERVNELRDRVMRPFNATTEGRQGSISGIPAQEAYCGEGRHLRLASGQTPRSGFATGTGGTPQPAEAARWNARQACPHSGVRYRRFVSLAGRRTGRLLTGAVVITRTHRARALCRQAAGIEDLVGFDIPLDVRGRSEMTSGMFWMTPAQLLDRFEYQAVQNPSDPQFSKGIPIIHRWAMLCSTENVSQAQFDELIRRFEAIDRNDVGSQLYDLWIHVVVWGERLGLAVPDRHAWHRR